MFVKPEELKNLLAKNNLDWKEHRGASPNVPMPTMPGYLRKRAKGVWSFV